MSKNNKGSENPGQDEAWNRVDASAASDGDIQRVHDELAHQKDSPSEGFSPVPILLVFLISALIVFSGIYMVWRSDDFDQMGYDETRRVFPWADMADVGPVLDPALRLGQRTYSQCAACHQQDGRGLPGAFPPLDGIPWVVGSEDRLIRLVAHGMVGPIEVAGVSYNGVMPGFANLSDEELAAVLTYIRQAWSNDAPAISPAAVAEVRSDVGPRPAPWNSVELLEDYPIEAPEDVADRIRQEGQ